MFLIEASCEEIGVTGGYQTSSRDNLAIHLNTSRRDATHREQEEERG